MHIKNEKYVYTIIPTIDAIENSNPNGRWFTEKLREYITSLFANEIAIHDFFYNDDNRRLTTSMKITPEIESILKLKSPGIFIEFVEKIDINLEEIIEKLKEAAVLALKYRNYTVLNEINNVLRSMY